MLLLAQIGRHDPTELFGKVAFGWVDSVLITVSTEWFGSGIVFR